MADGYDLNELTCVNIYNDEDTDATHLKRRIDSENEDWNIPNLPHDKDYHMFISYIQDNSNKVRIIVDGLERQGIKCCYHERDFLPGQQVIGNIHDSINRSMSILVVLSEQFVQSPFCMHEIEQAVHAKINKDYTIIPIKIEECEVPELLKNFTYIDAKSVETTEMHIKILDAFIWNVWNRDQIAESNGFTMEFPLTKYVIGCRWLSLSRYKLLFDDTCRRRIRKNGFEISDKILDDIQAMVSCSVYVKYAHIFNMFGRLTMLVFFMAALLFVTVLFTITEYALEPTINKKKIATIGYVFWFGLLFIFILWLCVMIVDLSTNRRCGGRRGMTRALKERVVTQPYFHVPFWTKTSVHAVAGQINREAKFLDLFYFIQSRASLKWALWKKINSRVVDSKTSLIIFKDEKVLIVRYDFKPCQDLFMRRCDVNDALKKKMLPGESLRAYVHRIFRNYMQENIEMLCVASESFGRHAMVNGAKCLCQLVEDSILPEEKKDL